MRPPRPLKPRNPGERSEPTALMRGDTNRTPGIVSAAEGAAHGLAKMGHSLKKSAGHAAHDILHGIGL